MHRKGDIRLIFIIRLLCIKIQLVSQWHTSSLVSVMFGRLLSLLSHLQGTAMRHFIGLFVNLATLMIVVLLFLAEALKAHPPGQEDGSPGQEKESVDAIKQKIHTSMAQSERVIKVAIQDYEHFQIRENACLTLWTLAVHARELLHYCC